MSDILKSLADWRLFRESDLRSEWGWLSLSGLFWLKEGKNSIGSDPTSTVLLPNQAANVGDLELQKDTVRLTPAKNATFRINGAPVNKAINLLSDGDTPPTDVRIGDYSLTVIRRSGQLAVRLRDKNNPIRTEFKGIKYFSDNPSLRFEAVLTRFEKPLRQQSPTAIGLEETETFIGTVELTYKQQTHTLLVQERGQGQIFLAFRDKTSGKSSYGAARFLLCPPPSQNRIDLDFNRAYNPPCAFTPWATCSLPPKENHLPFDVEAGEKSP